MPVTLAQWSERKRIREQQKLWPSAGVFWNDLAIFATVVVGSANVNLIGSLPGNEILAGAMLPFLLVKRSGRAFRREYLLVYILLGGWLFGTIAGDLYLGVTLANKMKGIARVVFLGIDFAVLAMLINGKMRGFVIFLLGDALSLLIASRSFGTDFLTEWKYGLSASLTLCGLIIASYFFKKGNYLFPAFMFLGLAALNLIYASRSSLAIDLMAAVLMWPLFPKVRRGKAAPGVNRTDWFKLVAVLVLMGTAAFGANELLKYAVSRQMFNESIQAKFEAQSSGKLGVLVGGRPETLVAIQAIIDSPIIGHGSFATDRRYVQMLQDMQYKYGYTGSDEADEESTGIPTHSHLTQAWVESGIFGGVFWIYVLFLLGRTLSQTIVHRPPLMPILAFAIPSFTWDVLYSPMGGVNRMVAMYMTLFCCDLLAQWSTQKVSLRARNSQPLQRKTIVRLPTRVAR